MTSKQYEVFPSGYWDGPRLDPNRRGDPSNCLIYCAVGAALTNWEWVEETLASLYLVLTDCNEARNANAVRRTFGAVDSNTVRRSMIQAAAETYFAHAWTRPAIKKPFEALIEAVRFASWRRNEIAHGRVQNCIVPSQNKDGTPKIDNLGAFLFAPDYMTDRQRPWVDEPAPDDPLKFNSSKYRYISSDIILFSTKFSELYKKIGMYAGLIGRDARGFPKNVVPVLIAEAEAAAKAKK